MRAFPAIVVVAAAASAACSLLLPYDDYPGGAPEPDAGGRVDSGTTSPAPVDAGMDVEIIDGGEVPDACAAIDRKTDPNNCGACGRRCVVGECISGRCPIVPLTPNGVSPVVSLAMASSPEIGETLYVTRESGALQRLSSDGGQGEGSLHDEGKAKRLSLSANGKAGIYGGNPNGVWAFRTNDFVNDVPDRIVTRPVGPILWTGSLAYFGDNTGLTWAEPKFDAPPTTAPGSPAVALAAYDDRIFWATADGDLFTMSAMNPAPEAKKKIVSTGYLGLTSLAVTRANIYLGYPGQGLVIYDYDPATLKTSRERIVSTPSVQTIATDNTHVYAVDFSGNSGRILRVNLDGKELTVLAPGLEKATGLTVAGDYVYFASAGVIQRTAK